MIAAARSFRARLDDVRHRVHRARRGAVIGSCVGLLAAVVLAVGVFSDEPASSGEIVVWLVRTVVPIAGLGAALGHLIGGGRLAAVVTTELGYDLGSDRIRRAVLGDPVDLSAAEAERAARYAALQTAIGNALTLRWGLLTGAVFFGQFANLIAAATRIDAATTAVTAAGVGVVSAVLLLGTLPLRVRNARSARTYSA